MNMAPLFKLTAASATLLALAACASRSPAVTAQPAPQPQTAATAPAAATSSRSASPAPAPAPSAPPSTASLPQGTPDQLMGLDAQGVTRLLGAPALKRNEGPAHVWQYANRLCVLDVVMYDEEGKARVSYVEMRDPAGGNAVPRNCYRSLLKTQPDGGA